MDVLDPGNGLSLSVLARIELQGCMCLFSSSFCTACPTQKHTTNFADTCLRSWPAKVEGQICFLKSRNPAEGHFHWWWRNSTTAFTAELCWRVQCLISATARAQHGILDYIFNRSAQHHAESRCFIHWYAYIYHKNIMKNSELIVFWGTIALLSDDLGLGFGVLGFLGVIKICFHILITLKNNLSSTVNIQHVTSGCGQQYSVIYECTDIYCRSINMVIESCN